MSHPEAHGPDEAPSRSELRLWEQALRQDWPIPPEVKKRLFQVAINLADPADEETLPAGQDNVPIRVDLSAKRDRVKLGALRVIAQFSRLSIEQQKLDLARERQARGKEDDVTDHAGGLDPAAAERALRALNEQPATPSDP